MPEEILLHGKVLRNYSKHDSHCLTLQTSIFYPTQKKENTSSPAIIKTRPEFDMLTLQYLFLMTCHIICKICTSSSSLLPVEREGLIEKGTLISKRRAGGQFTTLYLG